MSESTSLNICPGAGDHTGCIHLTSVKDGKIVKTKGAIYPNGAKDTICPKGLAGVRLPYHPDRLKYPLKRIGKRGAGKWARISWKQALDEIAAKIKKIREDYQPESVAMLPLFNSAVPAGGIQLMLGFRLQHLLQSTNLDRGIGVDSNPLFSNYISFGTIWGSYADPRTLVEGNTKYMIVWGGNPAEMGPRYIKYIDKARRNGAKLVDIGLIEDPTAKMADWWIPVKAGSDGVLALTMVGVIINEKRYDEEYVTRYTNGPFLVRTDNGRFLRENDIVPSGSPDKYVVWDMEGDQPQAVAPKNNDVTQFTPALSGTFKPGGIACKPVFQLLADLASRHAPENVEAVTGVSSETVTQLAREYASAKPAAILPGFGLRYKNSGNAYRAMTVLGALTGNIGVVGGGPINGRATISRLNAPQLKFNDEPIMYPTKTRARSIPLLQAFQGIITGNPYPIKAMITYASNLLHTFPNPQRWIDQVFPKLDLIVVNDIFMTATAEYADYVLPDCTVYEREDIDVGYGGYIVLLEKAIEPMYECRPPIYFWSGLAKRLGLGTYFDKTIEEWMAFRLNSKDPSVADIKPPLTLDRLKKERMIRPNVPEQIRHPFLDKKFLTASGRVELYCEELTPVGDALPVYREQLESPRSALAQKYPLVFNTANNKYFMHTQFANDPQTLKKYRTEPYIGINARDAEKRGISEGDIVLVYNDRGNCKIKATISGALPPGVVRIPHGWWPKQFIEGHLANLILPLASPETRDAAREIFWSMVTERAAVPAMAQHENENIFSYSPDTLFDCLCEVKKSVG
ncbi:MAG: molybdopterin-dependent oxidoreductase [Deltaproteobacteria bacterium]|nr:molybdopterin-dependent oxidoreductase [Deltaproteobacteria bacterium]